jgi:hypothetical protein
VEHEVSHPTSFESSVHLQASGDDNTTFAMQGVPGAIDLADARNDAGAYD